MSFTFRRARGALLRLALRRTLALLSGAALLAAGVWPWSGDYSWESGATDGLALIAASTGAALVAIGVSGRRPDWVDPGES